MFRGVCARAQHHVSQQYYRHCNTNRSNQSSTIIASSAAASLVLSYFLIGKTNHNDSQHDCTERPAAVIPLTPRSIKSSWLNNNNTSSDLLIPKTTQCDNAPSLNSASQHTPNDHHLLQQLQRQPSINKSSNITNDDSPSWHYEYMDVPARFQEKHAIFGALMKPNRVESYKVYRRVPTTSNKNVVPPLPSSSSSSYRVVNGVRQPVLSTDTTTTITDPDSEIVVATIRIGDCLNGHGGIVHGGILSLLFDDAMGFAYEAVAHSAVTRDDNIAVTANLTVNFRLPLPERSKVVLRVYHVKSAGRKMFFQGVLTSADDETIVYAEASSLYIWLKKKG